MGRGKRSVGSAKTPWDNLKGDGKAVLSDLNKSHGRKERESRIQLVDNPSTYSWEKYVWWAWRVGCGIDIGLILMAIYSKCVGWI